MDCSICRAKPLRHETCHPAPVEHKHVLGKDHTDIEALREVCRAQELHISYLHEMLSKSLDSGKHSAEVTKELSRALTALVQSSDRHTAIDEIVKRYSTLKIDHEECLRDCAQLRSKIERSSRDRRQRHEWY